MKVDFTYSKELDAIIATTLYSDVFLESEYVKFALSDATRLFAITNKRVILLVGHSVSGTYEDYDRIVLSYSAGSVISYQLKIARQQQFGSTLWVTFASPAEALELDLPPLTISSEIGRAIAQFSLGEA